jgi:hypothetical protein
MPATYIETREIPLSQLSRFPGNARLGDKDAISESLKANGQYKSLTVRQCDDGQLVILAGNNTFDVMQHDGVETARCELISCSDDEAKRINLVDNAASDRSQWDTRLLALQLADYDDPAMLIGSGFDAEMQAALMRDSGLLSDRATSFLDDFTDPGPDDGEGAGLPDPQDRPQPPGPGADETQYVQVHWLVTVDQRHTIHTALQTAREQGGFATAADALVAICQTYLSNHL